MVDTTTIIQRLTDATARGKVRWARGPLWTYTAAFGDLSLLVASASTPAGRRYSASIRVLQEEAARLEDDQAQAALAQLWAAAHQSAGAGESPDDCLARLAEAVAALG